MNVNTYDTPGSVCCRININFIASRTRDIVFHINPRLSEGIVVRNSMIGGDWGQEDRELSLNPFMVGQYFDVSSNYHTVFMCSPYNEYLSDFAALF